MLTRFACFFAVIITLTAASPFAQTLKPSEPVREKASVVKRAAKEKSAIELIEGKVLDVLEGDVITMLARNGTILTVRLQGIDAPDSKQDYFKKSRKSLSEMIEGKEVKVLTKSRDRADRFIGSVYFEGRDIGLLQLEKGMAWHYKSHASEQTADTRKRYNEAQEKAMAARLGLFEEKDPTAPWVFRNEAPPVTQNAATAPATEAADQSGKKYILGPRGGCYYVSESGRKVYVKDKGLCGVSEN